MNKALNKQSILCLILIIGAITLSRCTGSVESQLKTIAKESNEKCPKALDQWTRLDSCAAFGSNKYRSYHTISDILISDTTLFKSQLTPQIVTTIKTTPAMKYFRDNNIILEYQYNDQSGKYLFTVAVTPEEYK